ncbi:MAG TPA: hypothetical protein VED18_08040 [Candidatus Sulfotelmatobacter sp.]|nr:hypothetical protein [Candidatus Sulfotelmatobacter sp.]
MQVRLIERETRSEVGAYEVEGRPSFQRLVSECTARGFGLLWWRDGRPGEILCQVTRNREAEGPRGDSGRAPAAGGGMA